MLFPAQLKGNIRALAAKGDLTFAAVGRDIVECKRVHRQAPACLSAAGCSAGRGSGQAGVAQVKEGARG